MRGETTVTPDGLTATALIDTEYASFVSEGTRPNRWYRDGIARWPVLLRRNLDRIRA